MKNTNELFNTPKEEITSKYGRQATYSILLIALFLVAVYFVSKELYLLNTTTSLLWLHLVILVFAIFRLTKLFVTDSIFQWLRDLFLDIKTEKIDEGLKVHRTLPVRGLRRQIALLFDCPWCVSVWVSLVSLFIYYKHPYSRLFFLIMGLSGLATLLYVWIKKMSRK
jgi:hypothetical protein